MRFATTLAACAIVALASVGTASAAVVDPSNLVVYRVGNGSAALGNTATAVFLDEYTLGGALVQSIALPSSGATALTAVGNATTEGIMSRSQDGTSLVFAGYRKDAGGANPSADLPATTNRLIGTLTTSGVPATPIALTNPTGTIRSATTVDASNFYISTSVAVQYVAAASGTTTATSIDARNSRQVNLANNVLFASNGSTTITGKVQQYGVLPTGTTAASPVVTLATGDAINGFVVLDLDAGVAGPDTVYSLSTVEGLLRKHTFNGTAWSATGLVATSASNLTAQTNGTVVNLYLTSSSTLSYLSDATGYGGTLAGSFMTLATAGTNTAFRGLGSISLAAVPESTTIGGLGVVLVGLAGAWTKWRRSGV